VPFYRWTSNIGVEESLNLLKVRKWHCQICNLRYSVAVCWQWAWGGSPGSKVTSFRAVSLSNYNDDLDSRWWRDCGNKDRLNTHRTNESTWSQWLMGCGVEGQEELRLISWFCGWIFIRWWYHQLLGSLNLYICNPFISVVKILECSAFD
jgi:hypothetical protein